MNGNVFTSLRAANVARDKEWAKGAPFSLSFRGNELAGEVGEACNILKKLDRERMGLVGSRASIPQLAEELGDIVICVDLIAMDTGIDLWPAVAAKFNKTSDERGLATRVEERSELSRAMLDVIAERQRQIEVEGFPAGHDDDHTNGELMRASACYIAYSAAHYSGDLGVLDAVATFVRQVWPWSQNWLKVTGIRRSLVKGAALAVAEIDRLDRVKGSDEETARG